MTITATLYDHDLFTTPERPGMLFRREVGGGVEYCDKAEYDYMADKLAAEGIRCDVIDPRTTSPLDAEAILESVEVTGRLVIVDEANPRCSLAADVSSMAAEHAFSSLRAPIKCITAPHAPVPFAPGLEDAYVPSEARIEQAVRDVLGGR